ncbi:hypothetical protein BJ878DRAFT_543138 [Calycina marina]|uniref:Uncharacterized protein n=1 Tax=Calycina marina TaxID=1763456 RepID=A0A9P7Z1W8_9HELO|nr:hypothetical protein BJ878DRAFT_543138 [Calycina marina]
MRYSYTLVTLAVMAGSQFAFAAPMASDTTEGSMDAAQTSPAPMAATGGTGTGADGRHQGQGWQDVEATGGADTHSGNIQTSGDDGKWSLDKYPGGNGQYNPKYDVLGATVPGVGVGGGPAEQIPATSVDSSVAAPSGVMDALDPAVSDKSSSSDDSGDSDGDLEVPDDTTSHSSFTADEDNTNLAGSADASSGSVSTTLDDDGADSTDSSDISSGSGSATLEDDGADSTDSSDISSGSGSATFGDDGADSTDSSDISSGSGSATFGDDGADSTDSTYASTAVSGADGSSDSTKRWLFW